MIVVDTSVWIDYFRDSATWQVEHLARLIADDEPVALTDIVLTEILQGLGSDREARRVERRLIAFDVLRLEALDDFPPGRVVLSAGEKQRDHHQTDARLPDRAEAFHQSISEPGCAS